MNNYEQKLEARKERLGAKAVALSRESELRFKRADEMASCIPFGQPILVGHYSEKSDRAFRARIHSNMRKGCDLAAQAKDAERKAAAVGSGGISSDDPEAVTKLKEKLVDLELAQANMKAANRAIRAAYKAGIREDGPEDEIAKLVRAIERAGYVGNVSESMARRLMAPDFCGRRGFPDYELQNNNANIHRIKGRMAELEAKAGMESVEETVGDVRIVADQEDNRVLIFFPGKPDESTRSKLKASGFKWSPTRGAWVRMLTRQSMDLALAMIKTEGRA